ncbi:MAG TPA: DUF1207 domain-containing protein [Nitrospiraceae bacterium]|nr:DUF1207 domain-containing protein [Nitrospiraceae bacterium]
MAGFSLPTVAGAEPVPVAVNTERADVDCRFINPGSLNRSENHSEEEKPAWENIFLPDGDVFRPLSADPKQPQTFATMQWTRALESKTSSTVGSVALGETYGLWSRRKEGSCDGMQAGLQMGIFSQFDMFEPSTELINTDFIIGIPFSWRSEFFSARVRLYHQSSHLGDQFLLARPGFNRVEISFEEIDGLVSYDVPAGWGRVYAGGGYLIRREPTTLDRLKAQWGVELRGPELRSPLLGGTLKGGLIITPVFAADFKAFEELGWVINSSLNTGLEWFRPGTTRRLRVLLNYYWGYNPYGQFFSQRIQSVGLGLYLFF